MTPKTCEQCGNYFTAKRADAKFCSGKCRQNNYRERHDKPAPDFYALYLQEKNEGLGKTPEQPTTKVLNKDYIKLSGQLASYQSERHLLLNHKKKLIARYNSIVSSNPEIEKLFAVLFGGTVGGVVASHLVDKKSSKGSKITTIGLGALAFGATGYLLAQSMKTSEKEIVEKLERIKNEIKQLDEQLNTKYFALVDIEFKLKKVPKYVLEQPKEKKIYVPFLDLEEEKETLLDKLKRRKRREQVPQIINSLALQGKTFEKLLFEEKWEDFLGNPQPNFYITIFGKAGQGKSNFAFQFAEYLANHHGKVLYVSKEEGLSATTQGKIRLNKALSAYLDFTDIPDLQTIQKTIEERKYRFLVLDSINTLQFEPEDIQTLKLNHPHLGVVCIQQSTKNGEARGSNAFSHDADVVIEVEQGEAHLHKNRYAEKEGKNYRIFS